jgi:WD40 repeat protein
MLPALKNTIQELSVTYKKSFAETLCDDYRFELNLDSRRSGTRSIFYCKAEHSLLITHVLSSRVHILNLTTGKLRWFDHHGSTVRNVQVSDHEIITASWDGKICVTNFDTLLPRLILTEKEMGRCPDAAISPSRNYLYSYSYDSDRNPNRKSNTVRRWSMTNGELKKVIKLPGVHLSTRRCGSCCAHGNRLYVVSDSGHLHIYHSTLPILIRERNFKDQLQSICLAPDHKMLFIGGSEGNIYQCSLSGKIINQITKAHRYDVTNMFILPNKPDIMISVSFDGRMKIWRLPDLDLLASINVKGISIWSVTAVNDLLIVGGENDDIWIYDIKNLPEVIQKGKMVIADDSYAYIPSESNSFYASDLSMMQVRKNDDGSVLDGQYGEYLLNTACNFKVFKDLFSAESHDKLAISHDVQGFYQLTQ